MQGFHWDQRTKPPIVEEPASMMTSTGKIQVRVSVIVMNKKKVDKDLSKSEFFMPEDSHTITHTTTLCQFV